MAEISDQWQKIANRYYTYIKTEKRLSQNSVAAYMRDLRLFAAYILRHWSIPPKAVEQFMVERYVGWLCERKNEEPASQARRLSGVKSFFNFLMLEGAIESSPADFIQSPKIGRHLPDVLSVEEIDSMIGSIDGSTLKGVRDKAILELLYSCGLRVSELTSLKLSDLFFGEGYLRVVGKGDKQRLVPVSDIARDRVQIYLDERAKRGSASGKDILFLNNRDGALTRVMIFKIIKDATERAGIHKSVSPHTLRHSFATHLLEGGASVRQVQEMLGHENITTTEIYTHLDMSHLRETIEQKLPKPKRLK